MISSSDGTAGGAGLRLRVMTTSHAVDLWLGELERKNHSERTIDTYRRLLDKLADAHPHIDVDELSPTMIRAAVASDARSRGVVRSVKVKSTGPGSLSPFVRKPRPVREAMTT